MYIANMPRYLIYIVVITYCSVKAAFAPTLRYPLPAIINKITNANATCDSGSLNITVFMQQPFKGLLFAKDFSQECRSLGTLTNSLTLHLPTSGCGVRLTSESSSESEDIFYTVTLVIQQDRHLRQFTDQEYNIKCQLQNSALIVKSQPMVDAFKNILNHKKSGDSRTARMKEEGWSKDPDENQTPDMGRELTEALSAARAWMEILPEHDNGYAGTLQVGEPTLLMVKSTLPAGIGWKVVDCTAHDGLGESSQKLLDERGCPIDELLLPAPLVGPSRPIALMRHQEAVSRFAAFKFPDRDRLHLTCGLQLCRGVCQKADCENLNSTDADDNRLARTFSKGQQGEILDRFEVFNSVEVIAPGIELDEVRQVDREKIGEGLISPFGHLPGDRTFCVSPDKMAITFAVLGIIFLGAVVVAAVALMKARRSSDGLPYYTRSLFSSSSSGSGYGGSKLLLHESPCIGQSSARSVPYGRVF